MSEGPTFGPVATASDYEMLYGPLGEDEAKRVEWMLLRATAKIANAKGTNPGEWVEDERFMAQTVALGMVHRAFARKVDDGISQYTQTAGPYSESMTIANPDGALYLTKQDKEDLGIAGCFVGTARLSARHDGRCERL